MLYCIGFPIYFWLYTSEVKFWRYFEENACTMIRHSYLENSRQVFSYSTLPLHLFLDLIHLSSRFPHRMKVLHKTRDSRLRIALSYCWATAAKAARDWPPPPFPVCVTNSTIHPTTHTRPYWSSRMSSSFYFNPQILWGFFLLISAQKHYSMFSFSNFQSKLLTLELEFHNRTLSTHFSINAGKLPLKTITKIIRDQDKNFEIPEV